MYLNSTFHKALQRIKYFTISLTKRLTISKSAKDKILPRDLGRN